MARDINFLLKLYEKEYVKGEKRSNETQQRIRHEAKRKNRHLILDQIINEAPALQLKETDIRMIRYLIDEFNTEFQTLHRRASEETIILAFIFYVKLINKSSIRLESYRVTRKYKLTNHVFQLIISRMLLKFMEKCPIRPYNNYHKDEHEILIKTGER